MRPCSVLSEWDVCNVFISSTIRHLQCNRSSNNHAEIPTQAPFQWSWGNLQGNALGVAKQATNVQIVE